MKHWIIILYTDKKFCCVQKVILISQYLSFNNSLTVTTVFWAILALISSKQLDSAVNIHLHGIILLLTLIDLFVIKTPVYLFGMVYNWIYGFLYILFRCFLHISGVTSAFYEFLNYEENPSSRNCNRVSVWCFNYWSSSSIWNF